MSGVDLFLTAGTLGLVVLTVVKFYTEFKKYHDRKCQAK